MTLTENEGSGVLSVCLPSYGEESPRVRREYMGNDTSWFNKRFVIERGEERKGGVNGRGREKKKYLGK